MLISSDGEPLSNFIMWQDTRNRDIAHSLKPHDEYVFRNSGARINTVFTATKIAWFKQNAPDIYAKAAKALIVPDYLVYLLTGEFATDYTYGSRTHLMNINTLKWDGELCRLFGVDMEKLCELRPQGSITGYVTENFARITGMKSGVPVISAGGDQQCGALGLGVLDANDMEVNCGTGSFVISVRESPALDNPNVICNVAAIPGMYIVESNIISCASALDWLIREYFPEYVNDGKIDFDAVNAEASHTPAGAGGLYCVPHFQGCGTRDWNPDARAAFWGFSLSSKRRDMIRSLYEGIACEIAKSVDALGGDEGAKSVYIAGGLCKSDPFVGILSCALGRPLCRYDNIQATATGAFISAAVATWLYGDYEEASLAVHADAGGMIQPDLKAHGFYREYMKATEKVYEGMKG
ncbi:MAG: FGGY-family carbohydrate kinase, partial [Clostridia bacterium]|nr:FGGY-family carbohydrate kinase [Clostridia bacterium]